MSQRLRLYDLRVSDGPRLVGLCQDDKARIAQAANRIQERLLTCREVSDEGWHGTFAEMVFAVDPKNPYITTPRSVARIEKLALCQRPIPVQNQFYEFLEFGNGTMPKTNLTNGCFVTQAYSRNNAPTFVDLSNAPQILRLRAQDPNDNDGQHRVLLQGVDSNGVVILSQDVIDRVRGVFVTLGGPFADAPMQLNSITGIQKDVTAGNVTLSQVDPTTGDEVVLLTMEPSEQTAWYRRYLLNPFRGCCTAQVSAIVKLDLVPAAVDTDYLLLQSLEAIIEEWQAMRFESMDSANAKAMAIVHHRNAIGYLNGQLVHIYGKEKPAVSFAPFGSAHLSKRRIGQMI